MVGRTIWGTLGLVLGWLCLLGQAYVPAMPTNDSAMVQAGVNESDTSMLALQWCVCLQQMLLDFSDYALSRFPNALVGLFKKNMIEC